MELQPVFKQTVSEAIYQQIEVQILDGRLQPGEMLPSERQLSLDLHANRQAVREATKRLAQAGLVQITHGGSTVVQNYRYHAGLDLLPRLVIRNDGNIDIPAIQAIMEMRTSIGPDVAKKCAQKMTKILREKLLLLMQNIEEEKLVGGKKLGELNWQLWDELVDGSQNIAYRLAFNSLRQAANRFGTVIHLILQDEWERTSRTRSLVEAICVGDENRAETIAKEHLSGGESRINELIQQSKTNEYLQDLQRL